MNKWSLWCFSIICSLWKWQFLGLQSQRGPFMCFSITKSNWVWYLNLTLESNYFLQKVLFYCISLDVCHNVGLFTFGNPASWWTGDFWSKENRYFGYTFRHFLVFASSIICCAWKFWVLRSLQTILSFIVGEWLWLLALVRGLSQYHTRKSV